MRLFLLFLILVLLVSMLVFSSCQPEELDSIQVLERARKAIDGIDSYHEVEESSEISSQLQVQYRQIVDMDGLNSMSRTYIKDMNTSSYTLSFESVTYDGTLYTKDYLADTPWSKEAVRPGDSLPATQVLSSLLDIVEMDMDLTGGSLTVEQMDGMDVYHLHFVPVKKDEPELFEKTNDISSQDLWIATDTFYPVRFETLITSPEGSQATEFSEIRIIRLISGINEPVEIVPPI